jgi:hypothetical protein
MILYLPDEIANSREITASAKLVLAFTISNPLTSKNEAAKVLGMSRSSLFKSLSDLKKKGVSTSPPEWTTESTRVDYSPPEYTPHPRSVCKGSGGVEKKHTKSSPQKATASPPTQEEVEGYAASKGREDLVADFFAKYDGDRWTVNGEPMASWKRMFDGWARRRPKEAQPARRKRTLEEALYDVDKTY